MPTFRFTRESGELAFDEQVLTPSADNACMFEMPQGIDVTRGTYNAEVRFRLREVPTSCTDVANEIVVGVFQRNNIVIDENSALAPFDDEGEFYSRPDETILTGEAIAFDVDNDGIDNYAEVAAGGDPCASGTEPFVNLLVTVDEDPSEGEAITLDVSMGNDDGADFLVGVTISQSEDPSGTQSATFRARTDSPGVAVEPEGLVAPVTEGWAYELVTSNDDGAGAATWRLRFVPEEPFVGELTITAFASFGTGDADVFSASVQTSSVDVAEVADLTELRFFEVNGAGSEVLVTRDQVSFPEVEPAGTALTREFILFNGDVGTNEASWNVQLPQAATDVGVRVVRSDGARWALTWDPDNDDSLNNRELSFDLLLIDDSSPDPAPLTVRVDPLFNNPVEIAPPTAGALSLPSPPFVTESIPFVVVDPDRVDSAPTCVATFAAVDNATCTAPFDSVVCEATAGLAGDTWPFEVRVTPAADYQTACGDAPTFTLSLEVTDTPPAGAQPQTPQVTSLGGLTVRTSAAVRAGTLTLPYAFSAAGFIAIDPDLDGALGRRTGISTVTIPVSGDEVLVVTDLDAGQEVYTFAREAATDDVCPAQPLDSDKYAVDVVNHVVIVQAHDCTNDTRHIFLIDLTDLSVERIPLADACNNFFDRTSNYLPGEPGAFYFGCDDNPERYVVRVQSDGTFARQLVEDAGFGANEADNFHVVTEDASGARVFVWPDEDAVRVIDLDGFADGTATQVALNWPTAREIQDDIVGVAVDTSRDDVVFALDNRNRGDELIRVQLDPTATLEVLALESPSTLDTDLAGRLTIKPADADGAGVDLVVVTGSSGDPRLHVDLDTFTIAGERAGACTIDADCQMPGETCFNTTLCSDMFETRGPGLFASPDRRFLAAIHHDVTRGIWLYGYAPDAPRVFIELAPIPVGLDHRAEDVSISDDGAIMVFPDGADIDIIYFEEARQGLDQ